MPLVSQLQASLQAPSKAVLAAMSQEQREKDEASRITRQRGLLRVFAELELVGIVKPEKNAQTGDATFAIFRDLVRSTSVYERLSLIPYAR
jgi:regulator of nonsense transcripts 2